MVEELLGRVPRGPHRVVVRDDEGRPVVIRNHPLLDDGTPMPTLYWLLDRDLNRRIGRLEASGGVKQAEADVDPAALAEAHERYRAERDAELPEDWTGPASLGRRRRHAARREVPAHPLRLVPRGWRRPGGGVGGRTPRRRSRLGATMSEPVLAAIDCGTNSTRLLISNGEQRFERLMRTTRLGAGVDKTGRLDPEAIERTLTVLREYRGVMDAHGVTGVRIAATSAARDASNRDEFFGAGDRDPRRGPGAAHRPGGGGAQLPRRPVRPARGARTEPGGRHRRRLHRVRARLRRARVVDLDRHGLRAPHREVPRARPAAGPRSSRTASPRSSSTSTTSPERCRARAPPSASWASPARSRTWPRSRSGCSSTTATRIHQFVLTREAAEDVFRTLATESVEDRRFNPGSNRPAPTSSWVAAASWSGSSATSASTSASCRSPTSSTA